LLAWRRKLHEVSSAKSKAVSRSPKASGESQRIERSETTTGSFIFAGPTGVGKTLLCQGAPSTCSVTADALVHIDMSEYMEKHNVSRLIGAPPGFVG